MGYHRPRQPPSAAALPTAAGTSGALASPSLPSPAAWQLYGGGGGGAAADASGGALAAMVGGSSSRGGGYGGGGGAATAAGPNVLVQLFTLDPAKLLELKAMVGEGRPWTGIVRVPPHLKDTAAAVYDGEEDEGEEEGEEDLEEEGAGDEGGADVGLEAGVEGYAAEQAEGGERQAAAPDDAGGLQSSSLRGAAEARHQSDSVTEAGLRKLEAALAGGGAGAGAATTAAAAGSRDSQQQPPPPPRSRSGGASPGGSVSGERFGAPAGACGGVGGALLHHSQGGVDGCTRLQQAVWIPSRLQRPNQSREPKGAGLCWVAHTGCHHGEVAVHTPRLVLIEWVRWLEVCNNLLHPRTRTTAGNGAFTRQRSRLGGGGGGGMPAQSTASAPALLSDTAAAAATTRGPDRDGSVHGAAAAAAALGPAAAAAAADGSTISAAATATASDVDSDAGSVRRGGPFDRVTAPSVPLAQALRGSHVSASADLDTTTAASRGGAAAATVIPPGISRHLAPGDVGSGSVGAPRRFRASVSGVMHGSSVGSGPLSGHSLTERHARADGSGGAAAGPVGARWLPKRSRSVKAGLDLQVSAHSLCGCSSVWQAVFI